MAVMALEAARVALAVVAVVALVAQCQPVAWQAAQAASPEAAAFRRTADHSAFRPAKHQYRAPVPHSAALRHTQTPLGYAVQGQRSHAVQERSRAFLPAS